MTVTTIVLSLLALAVAVLSAFGMIGLAIYYARYWGISMKHPAVTIFLFLNSNVVGAAAYIAIVLFRALP